VEPGPRISVETLNYTKESFWVSTGWDRLGQVCRQSLIYTEQPVTLGYSDDVIFDILKYNFLMRMISFSVSTKLVLIFCFHKSSLCSPHISNLVYGKKGNIPL